MALKNRRPNLTLKNLDPATTNGQWVSKDAVNSRSPDAPGAMQILPSFSVTKSPSNESIICPSKKHSSGQGNHQRSYCSTGTTLITGTEGEGPGAVRWTDWAYMPRITVTAATPTSDLSGTKGKQVWSLLGAGIAATKGQDRVDEEGLKLNDAALLERRWSERVNWEREKAEWEMDGAGAEKEEEKQEEAKEELSFDTAVFPRRSRPDSGISGFSYEGLVQSNDRSDVRNTNTTAHNTLADHYVDNPVPWYGSGNDSEEDDILMIWWIPTYVQRAQLISLRILTPEEASEKREEKAVRQQWRRVAKEANKERDTTVLRLERASIIERRGKERTQNEKSSLKRTPATHGRDVTELRSGGPDSLRSRRDGSSG